MQEAYFGSAKWPLAVLLLLVAVIGVSNGDDTTTNDELGATAGDIIRKRGFLAEEHFVTTEDGAILSVWHARNPLIAIPTKGVLLFVHGTLANPQVMVINSVNARPKDYSSLNASQFSDEELVELLGQDPASNSLVFTSLNWGWDVWVVGRRGTRRSQGHTSALNQPYRNPLLTLAQILFGGSPLWPASLSPKPLNPNASTVPATATRMPRQVNPETTSPILGPLQALSTISFNLTYLSLSANPRYWYFSLDEQARYDLPAVMIYILNVTGRPKLSLVAHSAGGAIVLMALIDQPELAELIEQCMLWAPAFDLGDSLRDGNLVLAVQAALLLPMLSSYLGPVPPGYLVSLIQATLSAFCESELSQKLLCETLTDLLLYGASGFDNKINPADMAGFLESTGSQELAHLFQSITRGRMHYFDYGTPKKNMAVYGSSSPPLYQPARITSRTISIWVGKDDALVTLGDTKIFLSDVRVPIEVHLVGDERQRFNHISFMQHRNISLLLILPCLKRLETPFQL